MIRETELRVRRLGASRKSRSEVWSFNDEKIKRRNFRFVVQRNEFSLVGSLFNLAWLARGQVRRLEPQGTQNELSQTFRQGSFIKLTLESQQRLACRVKSEDNDPQGTQNKAA